MTIVSVGDLRNHCNRLLTLVAAGETIQIVERGTPIARIVPEPAARTFIGAGAGSITLPPDIDEPAMARWHAQG